MRSLNEKHLEQAFVWAMNKIIGGKEAFFEILKQNICRGVEGIEGVDNRLEELQRELMSLVKINTKLDTRFYGKEYLLLATEIERMREIKQKMKDTEAERVLRMNRIEELKDYIMAQEIAIERFDGDLFRRLIEKVKVQSMVEAVFVFKTGVEVREILG